MIELALLISLMVLFWHSCSWDGMIFQGIKKIIKPEWYISKPIYGCPICCTPWWGSLIFWLFFSSLGWQVWLFTIGAASGFAVIYVCLISLRDWAVEAKKSLEKPKKVCNFAKWK